MVLQFETRKQHTSLKDVLITVTNSDKSNNKQQDILRIRFANEVYKMIGDTNYIVMAATDTRLYFAASDHMNGWKVRPMKDNPQNASVTCKSPVLVGWAIHGGSGEYDLKFDQKEQLYFIEKEVLKFQQRIR